MKVFNQKLRFLKQLSLSQSQNHLFTLASQRFFAAQPQKAKQQPSKGALMELTEDSPYEFKNTSLKQYHHAIIVEMKSPNQIEFFKEAYKQLLIFIAEHNHDSLKQMLEARLYTEMQEYLKENVEFNEGKLEVLNQESDQTDILIAKHFYTLGLHVDRARNEKEQIIPYKSPQLEFAKDLEIYMSKLPMRYKEMPLNVVYELIYKTNIKLNISRNISTKGDSKQLSLIDENDLNKTEYHFVRYEGKIGDYSTSVEDIIKMKKKFSQFRNSLKEGRLDEVEEWTITNLDNCMNTFKKG